MRRALEEAFEMGMIHQIRRDVELARLKFPGVEVHLLQPSAALALRPLDFDQAGIARALERGRADALACLSGWATRLAGADRSRGPGSARARFGPGRPRTGPRRGYRSPPPRPRGS